jgi:hypothetical protein
MAHLKEVSSENGTPSPTPEKKRRTPPNRPIPTDRITFQRQLDLLRAFAAASGPSGKAVLAKDVAKIVNMVDTTVGSANPFFVSVGLLQKTGDGFVPSSDVQNYGRAYGWNKDTAATKLAPTIAAAWFAQTLIPRLQFAELGEDQAIDVLAEASAATPEYKAQLKLTIDYMEAAGLISREGGVIRAKAQLPPAQPEQEKPTMAAPVEATPTQAAPRPQITTMFSQAAEGAVNFHVTVKVDMGEFAGWQPDRIAAFFAGIAQVLSAKAGLEKEITR